MKVALGVIAALAILAVGIALVISVRAEPEAASPPAPPVQAPPPIVPPRPRAAAMPDAPPRATPSTRVPIPEGGFARWTGREGSGPGELEQFADDAGLRMSVALEQRRITLLMARTADVAALTDVLGAPPSGAVLAAIARHARVLHDTISEVQLQARKGALAEDDAIGQTRAAGDDYRLAVMRETGLSATAFDRLFSTDRPLP